jgi:hypothetical protein
MKQGGRNKFRTALATRRRGVNVGKQHPGRNIMKRLSTLAVTIISLVFLGVVLRAGDAIGQQKSLKEQLVGTWKLVSVDNVRDDGSKVELLGPNPKGVVIYTSDGLFALVNTRSDLPKFASNRRDKGTPEENQAVVQGAVAYFGTYAVNEAEKAITVQIEGSTFANLIGTDQKRLVTSLTADELKFSNPAPTVGGTTQSVWKRAK